MTGKLGQVIFARAVWSNFPWQRRTIPDEPKPAGLRWDLVPRARAEGSV